jgi:hypothetical protein
MFAVMRTLLAHRAKEAATEFQKVLDHPGIVGNYPLGTLAHLQLARARLMDGDASGTRGQLTRTSTPSGKTPIPTSPS